MSSDTLIILLPLVALILAGVCIAGLWYWWSSGQEDTAGLPEGTASDTPQTRTSQPAEPTVGDVVGKVTTSAQSWLANIARAASTASASSAPTAGYGSVVSPHPMADGEMVEVLRVLRDLADGSLVVEIGGRKYRSLTEIAEPQVKRRFLGNAQALALFAEAAGSPSAPWPAPTFEVTAQPDLPPTEFVEPLLSSSQLVGDVEPLISQEQPGGPKTMADEIEELIQVRLKSIPTLMHRSIHILQGAGGGIRVEVDGRYFDSVAGVTDPDVMAFLQSIIRQWEARQ